MSQYDPPPPPGGHNPPPPPGYGTPPPKRGKGMAITALVLGIVALLFSWTVVGGILFGLVALILGIVASGRAKRGRAGGRAMAIIGAILGLLGLAIGVALIALGAAFFNSDSAQQLRECLADAGQDSGAIEQCQREFQDGVQNQMGG